MFRQRFGSFGPENLDCHRRFKKSKGIFQRADIRLHFRDQRIESGFFASSAAGIQILLSLILEFLAAGGGIYHGFDCLSKFIPVYFPDLLPVEFC